MFQSTTVSFGSGAAKVKPFVWTYSRLKNFRDCPKRHYHYEIATLLGNMDDAVREPESAEMQQGFKAHAALAKRVHKNVPLPLDFVGYEPYAKRFCAIAAATNGEILVEQKWGMRRDYSLCDFFDKEVYHRQVCDAVILVPAARMAVVWDWKTGKPKALRNRPDDPIQVLLNAAVLMMMHPWLDTATCELIWLEHDMKTTATLNRKDVPTLWASLKPEVDAMEQAYNTLNYPPKKNYLCSEWCHVESCVHHGS